MKGRALVDGVLAVEAELSAIVVDRDPNAPPSGPIAV
jgi:hypothetical protein